MEKSQNPKILEESNRSHRNWKLPPVEHSRLEGFLGNLAKQGYEDLPMILESDLTIPLNTKTNDGMGVYELVDDEGDEPPITPEFDAIIKRFDEQTQAATEKTKDINLGTEDHPKVVQISATMEPHEENEFIKVLRDYQDVFAATIMTCQD